MIQFHETVMGRRFFEGTMPALIKVLERIANVLETDALYEEAAREEEELNEAHEELTTDVDEVIQMTETFLKDNGVEVLSCSAARGEENSMIGFIIKGKDGR